MSDIPELEHIFIGQVKRYPDMQPQDAVKLLYQNEFGGGHIISNPEASLKYLHDEFHRVCYDASLPLYEDIGNCIARLNLGAILPERVSAEAVNAVFVASANRVTGSIGSFREKLDTLRDIARRGVFTFGVEELDAYIVDYIKEGYPMLSHSAQYRNAYAPAYSVVLIEYIRFIAAIDAIEKALYKKTNIMIAIDGPCGSGKTTAAKLLAGIYDAQIISMDDFFLPPSLRTKKRLEEPGGNIHYERFLEEVAKPLREGKNSEYGVFDCSIMDFNGKKKVKPGRLLIIEGSYSMHPLYSDIYDLKVFTACPENVQRKRILERNGEKLYQRFLSEWIPMEDMYFKEFDIERDCDIVINTGL